MPALIRSFGNKFCQWTLLILCAAAFAGVACGNRADDRAGKAEILPLKETVSSAEYSTPTDTVVYITDTGEKYHRGTCSYLRKSKKEISLSEAKRLGYTGCKVCVPPK
jgi:hypothetical protein